MPKYVLIAGVNGAGKSTLYHTLENTLNHPRVNTDEIVRSLGGDWRNPADVLKAGRVAVNSIQAHFAKTVSFQQETTLCGKTIINNIKRAKAMGYVVEVYYIGVDTVEIAIDRVAYRVASGGHGVSADTIKRRYYESLENMRKIVELCDVVSFYDNTEKFRRIAIYRDGKLIREKGNLPQ